MCFSCEMDDKWPPFIEFIVWFLFSALNVGNHVGVWLVSKSKIIDITLPTYKNVTTYNVTAYNTTLNATYLTNKTELVFYQSAEEQWKALNDVRLSLLIIICVGAILFVVNLIALLPNVIQSCRSADPLALKESGSFYFNNLLKIHCLLLVISTVAFDIPAGCFVMKILSEIWQGPLTEDENLSASKMIIGLSLSGLAFFALYKGMMPLFIWIGNPFCFPCVPLRLFIVLPGGMVTLVMTYAPAMAVAKNDLLQFAPDVMQKEIAGMASTFFLIGMIFWGLFAMVVIFTFFCWYRCCREGASGSCC